MIHPITTQLKGYIVYADYRVDFQDFCSAQRPLVRNRHKCGTSDKSEGPYGCSLDNAFFSKLHRHKLVTFLKPFKDFSSI